MNQNQTYGNGYTGFPMNTGYGNSNSFVSALDIATSEKILFADQSSVNQGQVYGAIRDVLSSMGITGNDYQVQAVANNFSQQIDKLWQANQQDRAVFDLHIKDLLMDNRAKCMQITKLSQERKKTPRVYSHDKTTGYGICVDKGVQIKVGIISIQKVEAYRIEKNGTYTEYKRIEYTDSTGVSKSTVIPLVDITAKRLIKYFEGFIFSCGGQIANEFLAWYINTFITTEPVPIPEHPGWVFMDENGEEKLLFSCNNGCTDVKLLENCSDLYAQKILTDDAIQPDEIAACAEKYLDAPVKKALFAFCIYAALSSIFENLNSPVTQILTVSSPDTESTKQIGFYAQVYNKGKGVLSYGCNITKTRKGILTAKDENTIIKDCDVIDDEKRLAQVTREVLTLNQAPETMPHLTTLISNYALCLLPTEEKMRLTLDEDFYTRMTVEEESQMCYDLSRMTRYIVNVVAKNSKKWMKRMKASIDDLIHNSRGKDLPYMTSTTSYAVLITVIHMVDDILQIGDMGTAMDDLVYSMFQTETDDVEDCNDGICSEFINVLNTAIQNGSLDIEIYSQDMNYDANKPQVIVKGDLLLFDEATINSIILPQLKLTDNIFHLLNALNENMVLSTNKKLRYQTTVYSNGLPDRPAFIAVKGNEIIGKNERQMIEAKKCWEWFADKPLDTSFVPIVTNKLDYKAYQPYTYDKAENYHYLVIGASGSGKTHHLTERIVSLAKQGTKVIVIDASDSFKLSEIEEKLSVGGNEAVKDAVQKFIGDHFTFHNVDKDGMPVGIFNLKDINASKNTLLDIIYTILSAHKKDTGARQRAELRKLIEKCIGKDGFSIIDFHEAIKEGELSDSLSEQFEDLLDQGIDSMLIDTGWREFLASTKDIVVISFAALSSSTGYALVDMLLMSLFYYQRNNPNQNLAIFIDEVQNQNWNKNGPIVQVLREGRKYHMGMNYATQNLSGISKDKLQVMLGAGIKVYHRLDSTTAKVIAKETGRKATELTALKQGECIVDGTLYNYKEKAPLPGIVRGCTYRNFVKSTDNE